MQFNSIKDDLLQGSGRYSLTSASLLRPNDDLLPVVFEIHDNKRLSLFKLTGTPNDRAVEMSHVGSASITVNPDGWIEKINAIALSKRAVHKVPEIEQYLTLVSSMFIDIRTLEIDSVFISTYAPASNNEALDYFSVSRDLWGVVTMEGQKGNGFDYEGLSLSNGIPNGDRELGSITFDVVKNGVLLGSATLTGEGYISSNKGTCFSCSSFDLEVSDKKTHYEISNAISAYSGISHRCSYDPVLEVSTRTPSSCNASLIQYR
jgi:hypothetical protein